jgi:hypothetical protein
MDQRFDTLEAFAAALQRLCPARGAPRLAERVLHVRRLREPRGMLSGAALSVHAAMVALEDTPSGPVPYRLDLTVACGVALPEVTNASMAAQRVQAVVMRLVVLAVACGLELRDEGALVHESPSGT